jgi:hypothetical protein
MRPAQMQHHPQIADENAIATVIESFRSDGKSHLESEAESGIGTGAAKNQGGT